MSLVLDCSATIAWCFTSETTPVIDSLFLDVAANGACAPAIWQLEVANVLMAGVRKQRLSLSRRSELLEELINLKVHIDHEPSGKTWRNVVRLADRHGLTAYDASYLELAVRLELPLATLDQRLRAAASADGVTLKGL